MPLVSPGVDKLQQKQRWKFVLEKFSHNNHRRHNPIPALAEAQLLEMPECKRGRFVAQPTSKQKKRPRENGEGEDEGSGEGEEDGEERGRVGVETFLQNHPHSALLDVEPPVSDTFTSFLVMS